MLGFLFFLLVGILIWANFETRAYQITAVSISLKKPIGRSFKILHLSDTHFYKSHPAMARFFDRLALQEYDFIFATGDLIDRPSGIPYCVENLKKLKARHGFFAVFGNHDYYDYRFFDVVAHNFPGQTYPEHAQPIDLLKSEMEKAGIRVLRNETLEVEREGTKFLIHGLDDPTTGRANIRTTLSNFNPAKVNVLLSHTIDAFLDIGEGEIDLSFSGHSHGGQVRLPFFGPIVTHTMLGRPYASGLKRLKGAVCCVSRGIGTSRFLPVRFLCRPEAVVLEIKN